MSGVKGKVGKWALSFGSVPRGGEGRALVEYEPGKKIEVRWHRDSEGIWVEFPDQVAGFDIQKSLNDDGAPVFDLSQRGFARGWKSLVFLREGEEEATQASSQKKKGMRIRAQMPGKIVRVLVKAGADVEKGQPLLVMEAMKMENEIRAPLGGKVQKVHVNEGQAVDSGADLALIE